MFKGFLLFLCLYFVSSQLMGQVHLEMDSATQSLFKNALPNKKQHDSIWKNKQAPNPSDKSLSLDSLHHQKKALDSLYKTLRSKIEQYDINTLRKGNIVADEVRSLLPDSNTALLEYSLINNNIFLFVVTHSKDTLYQLPKDTVLNNRIDTYLKCLSDRDHIIQNPQQMRQNYHAVAHQLYKALLEEALQSLGKRINRLIIIPDGKLGLIPFEALLTAPSTSSTASYRDLPYLLKDYQISYAPSINFLKTTATQNDTAQYQKYLAFAPQFNASTNKQNSNAQRVNQPTLPGTGKELEALAKYYEGVAYAGEMANESNFKEKAHDYAVLHISGIGKKKVLEKDEIAIVLATPSDTSREDGQLNHYEIKYLNLKAQLTFLAISESGVGPYQAGEGIMSLGSAFLLAGSQSVIQSLWVLSDEATATITGSFYQQLAKGETKDAALRWAKLEYLAHAENELNAHPFFWAPLVATGNMDAVEMEKADHHL